jgi:hypothetical protein
MRFYLGTHQPAWLARDRGGPLLGLASASGQPPEPAARDGTVGVGQWRFSSLFTGVSFG